MTFTHSGCNKLDDILQEIWYHFRHFRNICYKFWKIIIFFNSQPCYCYRGFDYLLNSNTGTINQVGHFPLLNKLIVLISKSLSMILVGFVTWIGWDRQEERKIVSVTDLFFQAKISTMTNAAKYNTIRQLQMLVVTFIIYKDVSRLTSLMITTTPCHNQNFNIFLPMDANFIQAIT